MVLIDLNEKEIQRKNEWLKTLELTEKDYVAAERSDWALNDQIVQSYRNSMIASQSLLMSVAAAFYQKNDGNWVSILICMLGLFNQWAVWAPVIYIRTQISDFHKFNTHYLMGLVLGPKGEAEQGDSRITEHLFTSDQETHSNALQWVAEKTGNAKYHRKFRPTRVKLDVTIPAVFTIIWFIILYKAGAFYEIYYITGKLNLTPLWIAIILGVVGFLINLRYLLAFFSHLRLFKNKQR